ncbi:DUF418 domain-containing protein [Bacillus sp. 1NLA3E]|uniref:DUF418 domain-containing protein n=1 Tax=Bacillus sp. 1NLA3E TaxID=666686 RepID=UPI000247E727|nr:DUF418 domain-containing protein [Bacillus sp. 1NLA3E]AGK52686.1 hypothetical protein B1NLA3E_04560 [Bacillus sp. 1NLA3E]
MSQNSGCKTEQRDRIVAIDIIRGISIFGIFLVNMMSFHSPLLYVDPHTRWHQGLEKYTYRFIDVFAEGSFYPLFALLFGYSFVLFREKVVGQGMNFTVLALRRLFFLLVVGIIHAFFIWHGDILIQYSILGFIFIFFVTLPERSLLSSGLYLYGVPVLFLQIWLFVSTWFMNKDMTNQFDPRAVQHSLHIYQQGTISEITKMRITDWMVTNNTGNIPFLLVSIFPLFLIGAGFAKQKLLERSFKRISQMMYLMLSLGLMFKFVPYLFEGNPWAQYTQESIGGLCLAIFYGAAIIKITQHEKMTKWLSPIAAVGRMSISNYLFQSIISTCIFYSYGFGFYGKISLFSGTILVIIIFIGQIITSNLWLKRFSVGPVEWIWRCFTYMKVIKLRK